MRLTHHLMILCLAATTLVHTDGLSAREFQAATPEDIARLAEEARPGDTIIMQNGQWRDVDILFEGAGTEQSPITLRAETPGQVVISGPSRLRIAGRYLVVDGLNFHEAHNDDHLIAFRKDSKELASHCRLTNCAVVDCNTPDAANESRWISLFGQHNRIDHCWIEGKRTKGTTVAIFLAGGPAYHRIDHNHFGPRPDFERNGGETIRVGDSQTSLIDARVVVEHNLFEECSGESEIISNKSCENIYRHNTFLRSGGALTLRHGHRCLVDGNIFLGQRARGTGGVRIIGEDHRVTNNYFAELEGDDHRAALSIMRGIADSPASGYSPVTGALVAFNTFINCKETIVVGLGDKDAGTTVPPADCTIANNLIMARRPPIQLRSTAEGFQWRANLMQTDADVPNLPGIQTVDDFHLVEDESGLWRPAPSSPAIDAAATLESIERDIDSQRRQSPTDIGCDDVSEEPKHSLLLQPGDVGPAWRSASGDSP